MIDYRSSAVLVDDLRTLLHDTQIDASPSVLQLHSKGEAYPHAVLPEAVVYPESTLAVERIVSYAYENGVAVTPVGVNSSLEGQTVPVRGGISLDLTRMNRIVEFKAEDLLIVVQPGVTYPQINDHTRRSGLFFPVDPGAHASIGGMISTNASGTAAVRYGVTGDYVLALEVVTPTGRTIRCGSRARKSSSGYALARLFTGAEGTLGVVTEATIRLVGLPEAASVARVAFPDVTWATRYVTSIIQAGVPVARCELMDALSIHTVNDYLNTDLPEQVTVFLEFHGNPAGVEREAELAQSLAEDTGALGFEASSDVRRRAEIWRARHSALYAKLAANPNRAYVTTDLAVPISALPEAVDTSLAMSRRLGLTSYLLGHVGDGNFHLGVFYAPDDPAAVERIEALTGEMAELALRLGGTCTGEHGVGLRKLPYMAAEHGESLEVMRAIKRSLDPADIMNPDKKLPR